MRRYRSKPESVRDVKRRLVGDSIERKKLVEKLVKLVREEERKRK